MMARGRSRRARVTPRWVFVAHLVLVFGATWGAMWAFSTEHQGWGLALSGLWLVLFVVTSLDNVRIQWFDWLGVRVGVWVDTLRSVGESEVSSGVLSPGSAEVSPRTMELFDPEYLGEINRSGDEVNETKEVK